MIVAIILIIILFIVLISLAARSRQEKADAFVSVKSLQALEKYDAIKFLQEHSAKIMEAEKTIKEKGESAEEYYLVRVQYVSPAGRKSASRDIAVRQRDINRFRTDLSLRMGKGEYAKYVKEQNKDALERKQRDYYNHVNNIIDQANKSRDYLAISGSQEKLDRLIGQLYDRTVNSIKKIKTIDSEEWSLIKDFIIRIKADVGKIISTNQKILDYYKSPDFAKIKETCEALMSSQREFNEYINEKVQSVSHLFGTRVTRNETVNNDEYNYIRPYKKTVTPFTAEVSASVFASAENNPLEYIVKYFYPNKKIYPKQIQKLCQLVDELETLRDAKQIIENYKTEYQQYLGDVPDYVLEYDEAGFYSRLGFATIDDSVLAVEYKFSYTSGGGMAHRSFTVPMTEETISELINALESRLTASAFAKEQRTLMTKKMREFIKTRDNFTCCKCGNSVRVEPNLLLEIDHIIPVSKGGRTAEDNLQTLCWKCNRAKSNKIMVQ